MTKHDTILIASGDPDVRAHLRKALEQRYHLLEASKISQMSLLLQHNIDIICAVVIDTSLRNMEGKEILLSGASRPLLDKVPVILCAEDASSEELSIFLRYGAADVVPLNSDPYTILRRVETIADLHLLRKNLETLAQEKAELMRHSSDGMVDALSSIIEYRSVESGNHILRVRYFTRILMEEVMESCPEYELTDRLVTIISSASALHDIGKIAIPDAILLKPQPLTPEEWEIMKTHSITGCEMLDNLRDTVDQEYLRYAWNICRYHHERWDGSGHPEGLRGEEIPICAQVVGLADAYDALTSNRVYKGSYSSAEAVNMILKGECGAFSPKLLECFKNVTDKFDALAREYADGRSADDSPFDLSLPKSPKQVGTVDHVQAMYQSLVHYINAFMVEVELDKQIFHIIYNPYPEIAPLHGISSLQDLKNLLLDRIVVPKERDRMLQLLTRDIPQFVAEDLRRASYFFHFQSQETPQGTPFEMTLLRSGASGRNRRTLAVVCRKVAPSLSGGAGPMNIVLPAGAYICRNDRNFTLVRLDDRTVDMGGYSPKELREDLQGKLVQIIHPEDRELVRREFTRQLEYGTVVRLDHRVIHKSGSVVWVSNKSRMFVDDDGLEYLYCTLSDISAAKLELEQLRAQMARYEVILAQTENVLFQWDLDEDRVVLSDTWEQVFGRYPTRENLRQYIYSGSLFHPDDVARLLGAISALESGSDYEMLEARVASRQGRYLWCRIRASAARDKSGRLTQVMGIIINIDVEKQAQRALQDRAERDSLTKLLNKEAGRRHAESYLSQFASNLRCAVLILDLDDFKGINDRFGHLFGDAVLTKTARAIENHFQSQDIVARIGGDEFMVLVRGVADRRLLSNRCASLISTLEAAVHSMNSQIRLHCSIGVALAPEHGNHYYDLFQHADQALYQAKAQGKNTFCFYDGTAIPTEPEWTRATPIESNMEPGLAENNFVHFAFQKLFAAQDIRAAVNDVLAILGRRMNVSRVYIFENSPDDRFCRNTFEWCNLGITPEIDSLQQVSYETDIPGYSENFNENGVFYCPDVTELPPAAYEIVKAQGIQSMLQCAIRQDGAFRGYIGFDECAQQRHWTKEEISMLSYFTDVLAVFLRNFREQEQIRIQAEELSTILDNQNSWIYVVDPESFHLRYLNRQARTASPNIQLGIPCYRALQGRSEPCPGCPVAGIREKGTDRAFLDNPLIGGRILAEATMIRWQDAESCLMTCHQLPDTQQA